MAIRLNKILKELNVGLSTAVEFLQKKGYSVEKDTNAKIDDEAYETLKREFDKDKNLKSESVKISLERHQKEKKESLTVAGYESRKKTEEIKIEVPDDIKPKFVVKGKMDLDAINKKKPAPPVEDIVPDKMEETPVAPPPIVQTPVITQTAPEAPIEE
jgi:translation initiation factor IF-2